MTKEFELVLKFLHESRKFDFSPSRYSSLERKINHRLNVLKLSRAEHYIQYLESHPEEWTSLIDLLTINVSRFFRNLLTFETIAKRVLPTIIARNSKQKDPSLRIWSAGCANGEEPYSIAILIHDILKKDPIKFDINIFATDINETILTKAKSAIFELDQMHNVKLGFLENYFSKKRDHYLLKKKIKQMVSFSFYDIINTKTYVPPESVYGNFDMVFCRNLLIYFHPDRQKIIFDKLFRALAPNGYLILGEAERLPARYQDHFTSENDYCHIYHKTK